MFKTFIVPYVSKKPNPNAEKYIHTIPCGPPITQIEVKSKIEWLPDNYIIQISNSTYTYMLYGNEAKNTIQKLLDSKIEFKSSTYQDTQQIYSLSPEPLYLYEYDKTFEVECDICKQKFPWTELESDCVYDEDGYEMYNDTICPYCGAWSCCILEFQK